MRTIGAVVLAMLSSAAAAQELTVVCRYEHTTDDAGKISPTIGEFSAVVTYMLPIGRPKNLHFRTTKAPCYDFIGDGDEIKVEGTCVRFLEAGNGSKMKMTTNLTIDRVSGAFQQMVQFNDKPGLIHNGRCTAAKKAF